MTEPPADWREPRWTEVSRVHNWRNHVPEEVEKMWTRFSDDQKQALARWADTLADNEHWD